MPHLGGHLLGGCPATCAQPVPCAAADALQPPEQAKRILAQAVVNLPQSVKVWMVGCTCAHTRRCIQHRCDEDDEQIGNFTVTLKTLHTEKGATLNHRYF